MKPLIALAVAFAFLLSVGSDAARAQLFGERTLGKSLSAKDRTAGKSFLDQAVEGAGQLDENARYVRGNRTAEDFVGADKTEVAGFVGMSQVETDAPTRSAVDNLRVRTGQNANRTIAPPMGASLLNSPRLQLALDAQDASVATASEVSSQMAQRLTTALRSRGPNHIEVSLEDCTAIVRGVVASERERTLAAILLQFEPGVDRVLNELVVQPAQP